MSGTAPAKVSQLTDMQKSDKYQQALSLNLDCGSDTLRKLIEKKLSDKNTSLKKYVHDQAVQTKLSQLNLFKEQKQLLNGKNPDLLTMDISLLTLVLLELFSLDMTQEDAVKRLRKCRNTLAHSPRSQLEDDQVFNEASQHIIGLSKDTTPEFEKEIKLQIKELKERKLVRTHSMLDIVRLLNESFMVKLMDKGDVDNVDVENEIWIKYCLTKFVRLLARSYEMDILLQKLKDAGVITATTKRTIEHIHHAEKQFQQLVVFMVDETRENLLKFCCVMREMNSDIADFVIHNHDGSRDIGKVLKDCEKEKVEAILKSSLVVEKKGSVSCEDLHTLVNERRRCFTNFDTILECMKELFSFVSSDDRDTQFCGITWSDDVDDFDAFDIPDDKMSRQISTGRQQSIQNASNLSTEDATFEDQVTSHTVISLPAEIPDKMSRQISTGRQPNIQNTSSLLTEDATLEDQVTSHTVISLPAEIPAKRNQEALTVGAVGGISVSDEINSTALAKTKLPADTTVVTLEEESRHVVDSVALSATGQSIVCVFGGTENNIHIVVLHVPPKSYIYYIDKDLVDRWHLDDLLTNKDVNIVFSDIRTASVSLMTEYEILIDGHIWDIQLMLDKCSLDSSETERLKECGFTQETVARWTKKDTEYGSKLAPGDVDMLIILDLVARAKLIRKVYDLCKGNLDTDVRSSKLYSELRKDIFAAAHPSSMEEKVNQLKRRQKKKRQKLNKAKNQDENQKVEDSEHAEQALGKQTKSKQKKGKKK